MRYMGSKRLIASKILPIMTAGIGTDFDWVEPFAGGMNMIDKVETTGNKIANDLNSYVIEMFRQGVSGNFTPRDAYTRKQFDLAKALSTELSPATIGYLRTACAFGGSWDSGGYIKEGAKYIKRKDDSRSGWANEQEASKRTFVKQCKKLKNVSFSSLPYDELFIADGSIVYCDPPYENTTGYGFNFDSAEFWQWVRDVSDYATVYVSEYTAPDDMTRVWSKRVTTGMSKENSGTRVEGLFTYL